VTPRRSILAEVPACVVGAYADRRGTRDVAEALLAFLFSAEAQEMLAASGLRPVSPEVGSRLASAFPLPAGGAFTVADLGGWEQVDRLLFAPGAVVDDLQNVGRDASVSRSREEALPAGVPPS
jgi:sulfate transport system substrate-binding protein